MFAVHHWMAPYRTLRVLAWGMMSHLGWWSGSGVCDVGTTSLWLWAIPPGLRFPMLIATYLLVQCVLWLT